MMKIYKIAQFGRADQMAELEYRKYLEYKTINDIKIEILNFFRENEISDHNIKINISPKRKENNEVDLIINITGMVPVEGYYQLVSKKGNRELSNRIKNIVGVYPIISVEEPSQKAIKSYYEKQKITRMEQKKQQKRVKEIEEELKKERDYDTSKASWGMSNKDLARMLGQTPQDINNKRPTSLMGYAVNWDKVDWNKSDNDIALENGVSVSQVFNKRSR